MKHYFLLNKISNIPTGSVKLSNFRDNKTFTKMGQFQKSLGFFLVIHEGIICSKNFWKTEFSLSPPVSPLWGLLYISQSCRELLMKDIFWKTICFLLRKCWGRILSPISIVSIISVLTELRKSTVSQLLHHPVWFFYVVWCHACWFEFLDIEFFIVNL